jgi:penicillin-binding protein-related factor A (putative recombinase)
MSNFTFKEGNQKFIFKSSWDKVLQFDKITDYKNISNKVTCTKGVDFLGIFQGKKICFLEIKDFRKELKKSEKL